MFLITENFWVSIKLSNMTLIAMLTSSSVTYSLRCIFACPSAILIMDSICRTVIGIEPVAWKRLNHFGLINCHFKFKDSNNFSNFFKTTVFALRSKTFHSHGLFSNSLYYPIDRIVYWYIFLFSLLVCLILYWYRWEKFCLDHSWELKG